MATDRSRTSQRAKLTPANTDLHALDDAAETGKSSEASTAIERRAMPLVEHPFPLPELSDRDSYASTAFADIIDRSFHAAMARTTRGLSPAALGQAYLDWWMHLVFSPGKQMQLAEKAQKKIARFTHHAINYTTMRLVWGTNYLSPNF